MSKTNYSILTKAYYNSSTNVKKKKIVKLLSLLYIMNLGLINKILKRYLKKISER